MDHGTLSDDFCWSATNPYVTEDFSLFPNKTTTNIIVEMYEREIIKNNLQLDQNIRE